MNRYDTEETEEETEQREKKYLAFMQADEDAKNGARALHEEQAPKPTKHPAVPLDPCERRHRPGPRKHPRRERRLPSTARTPTHWRAR